MEDYYATLTTSFSEPKINRWVRIAQGAAFISFVIALLMLGTFAAIQAGDKTRVGQQESTALSTATASSSTSTTPYAITAIHRGQGDRESGAVSGAFNAAAPSEKALNYAALLTKVV